MVTYIPRRYTEAKWQARITESENQFVFSNGLHIASLFELKQALVVLPDDVINPHTGDDHHIASWIEHVVGNRRLAQALVDQHNRWGLIVTLERQQMRTLNLPDHIARYWLRQVSVPFTFTNGATVDSLTTLKDSLQNTDESVIDFHLERVPNDISSWVGNSVGDFELAELLEESSNGPQMYRFTEDHLAKLQEVIDSH
jgi:hypothetical protein